MERTPHWSLRASSDTVSFTFTSYHTWQFVIFTIFIFITLIFLSLVQSFILHLRLGSLVTSFHHRPFPYLPDWFHGLSDHLMFLLCSTAGFVCILCWTKPALSRFSNAQKNQCTYIHSFIPPNLFFSIFVWKWHVSVHFMNNACNSTVWRPYTEQNCLVL